MKNEEKREEWRKNIYIFILVMKYFINTDNLFNLYYYWESIGILSYILINNWYKKKESIKTLIYNKIGDITLLYVIIEEEKLRNITNIINIKKRITIFIFLFLIIKSVQLFSFPWLLNAMVSPTPVSSLLHSTTIVCTGIYIIYKFNYNLSSLYLYLLILYSLFSLFIGLTIKDIKKIIAISTSNNINIMFIKKNSYIHMLNHGLLKSLIFIYSGFIIHNSFNQDIRKLRGYLYIEPLFLKLFIMLFIPLPYLFLYNSKEYLLLNSPSYIYIYIYLVFSYVILKNIRRKPTYTYYLTKKKINIYILLIIPSLLFSLYIPNFYSNLNLNIKDILLLLLYLLPTFSLNINIEKHYENIINKIINTFNLTNKIIVF